MAQKQTNADLLAANLGDDADTTAAIYGNLAGAHYGVEAIPAAWRAKLADHDLILTLADQLLDLADSDHSSQEVRKRIRILNLYTRPVTPEHFGKISRAVLTGKRLRITHYSRQRDEESERDVSPQRLVHYRDNWYLDT